MQQPKPLQLDDDMVRHCNMWAPRGLCRDVWGNVRKSGRGVSTGGEPGRAGVGVYPERKKANKRKGKVRR